ncbi:hypothetical protein WOLCODRAFT_159358 [Wolfiporia cocos MD-104 SS10]|uniref:Uncharacterized protein n=1 Tax=Wolfiporia cocos (strain MD-104) TaxID=742152 RepID=A0A2H3JI39_WOLCO|nr:hypothetical protein WOLCODRAFT_159358 [Wolfiporia cocos MD-104 SS10]
MVQAAVPQPHRRLPPQDASLDPAPSTARSHAKSSTPSTSKRGKITQVKKGQIVEKPKSTKPHPRPSEKAVRSVLSCTNCLAHEQLCTIDSSCRSRCEQCSKVNGACNLVPKSLNSKNEFYQLKGRQAIDISEKFQNRYQDKRSRPPEFHRLQIIYFDQSNGFVFDDRTLRSEEEHAKLPRPVASQQGVEKASQEKAKGKARAKEPMEDEDADGEVEKDDITNYEDERMSSQQEEQEEQEESSPDQVQDWLDRMKKTSSWQVYEDRLTADDEIRAGPSTGPQSSRETSELRRSRRVANRESHNAGHGNSTGASVGPAPPVTVRNPQPGVDTEGNYRRYRSQVGDDRDQLLQAIKDIGALLEGITHKVGGLENAIHELSAGQLGMQTQVEALRQVTMQLTATSAGPSHRNPASAAHGLTSSQDNFSASSAGEMMVPSVGGLTATSTGKATATSTGEITATSTGVITATSTGVITATSTGEITATSVGHRDLHGRDYRDPRGHGDSTLHSRGHCAVCI